MKRLVLVTCLLISASAAAEGENFTPGPDRNLVNGVGASFAMPCQVEKVISYNSTTLVGTCSDRSGLLVVDVTKDPVPLSINGYGGHFINVFTVGEQVWLDLVDGSAPLVLEQRAPANAVALEPTAISEPTAPTSVGAVIEVSDRDVVIDLGTEAGFKKGDAVEFFVPATIQLKNETVKKDDTLALGRIKSVSENRAVVQIGLNQTIEAGTPVRYSTKAFNPNYMAPPRVADQTELGVTVRPFLPLGTLGGGAIVDAWAMYRFEGPIAVEARLSPLGFALTNQGNAGVFAAHGFLSYDHRLFQVGLGLGAARFESDQMRYEIGANEAAPDPTSFGVSAAQYVRLGARDGLNITATTNFVVRDSQFEFGGLSAEVQVPLSEFFDDSWVVFRGGGGIPGHVFTEIGLRTLVTGDGAQKSVFITPTLGYANISTQEYAECSWDANRQCLESEDYGGPMVGVTLEWRP